MLITKEFCEKRVQEQKDYIATLKNKYSGIRYFEILESAANQLNYFKQKLEEMNTEKSTTDLVKEFHEMFEHPIGPNPSHEEPRKIRQLRVKLLFEELIELAEASDVKGTMFDLCSMYQTKIQPSIVFGFVEGVEQIEDGDNVDKLEELDAITDIQYVLDGKKLTSGLHTVTDEAFKLVHGNNMTKAHRSQEHCMETKIKNNIHGTIRQKGESFLLYNDDEKLTKPWDHKKVGLSHLVNK